MPEVKFPYTLEILDLMEFQIDRAFPSGADGPAGVVLEDYRVLLQDIRRWMRQDHKGNTGG